MVSIPKLCLVIIEDSPSDVIATDGDPDGRDGSARWVENFEKRFEYFDEISLTIIPKPTKFSLQTVESNSLPQLHAYTPIGPGHIRLLKCIQPLGSSSMRFEFITLPLEKAYDQFVAISYCWGSAVPDRFLPLKDGSHILVTENVETLLTHILTHDEDLIWLDAICINQEDTKEKGLQVQVMKDIYKSARRVSVWLGVPILEQEEYRILINFARELSDTIDDSNLSGIQEGLNWLGSLMRMQWWHRIWVVQEVCYGRTVWFHYGRIMMPKKFIERIFRYIAMNSLTAFKSDEDGISKNGSTIMQTFGHLKDLVYDKEKWLDLEHVYEVLVQFKSTDPRDRIFAILSLATPPKGENCITPNYNTGVRDVFVHAMGQMAARTIDFAMLGHAGTATPRQIYGDKALPSWVPDFAASTRYRCLSASPLEKNLYQATPGTRPAVMPGVLCEESERADGWRLWFPAKDTPICDHHGSLCPSRPHLRTCSYPHREILGVVGSCFDIITGCGIPGLDLEPSVTSLLQFIEEALQIANSLASYSTGESPEETCWRTLVANCIGSPYDLKKPDVSFGTWFNTVLQILREANINGNGEERAWKHVVEISGELQSGLEDYPYSQILRKHCEKRVFWTKRGYLGLALNGIQIGDSVWLINGAKVPFITRPSEKIGPELGVQLHQLVCEAYVHGVMDGEAMKLPDIEGDLLFLE
ncbi:MAG: hypothetical protein M1839_004300 [Geoglossum umbratile]|nr:MAG: hypothetical protein M1839_004300 [Geoglossum umbratile]